MVKMQVFASAFFPEGSLAAGFNPDKSESFAIYIFANSTFRFPTRGLDFRVPLLRRVRLLAKFACIPLLNLFWVELAFNFLTDVALACSTN